MLRSMTGFGAATYDDGVYNLNIEVKSVNNRYCDIQIKLPGSLRSIEPRLQQQIKGYNFRGKIDVFIKFKYNPEVNETLTVDKGLLIAYYKALKSMATIIHEIDPKNELKDISYEDLLHIDGIITNDDNKMNLVEVEEILRNTLAKALDEFDKAKIAEGKVLEEDLRQRIDKIANEYLKEIKNIAPVRLEKYKNHIEATIDEILENIDLNLKEQRILQEVAIMADKLDITEELTRYDSHIKQFYDVLESKNAVGRSIDFLLQEMNRETNTIASKANDNRIAHLVVFIKSELEKIREQIQNIE